MLKTWEVWKIALENPKAKFTKKDSPLVYYFEDGRPMFFSIPRNEKIYSNDLLRVDEDWELVREPVDFMTAFEAWKEGKTITVERSDPEAWSEPTVGTYQRDKGNCANPWFYADDIIHGKWYIE